MPEGTFWWLKRIEINIFFIHIVKKLSNFICIILDGEALSGPKLIGGVIEAVSLGCVSLYSSVLCGFVRVCSESVAHFLLNESNSSSVSFLGIQKSRFIHFA